MTWPMPGVCVCVCSASGGNDMCTSRIASSRATTAMVVLGTLWPLSSVEPGGRMLVSIISADTFSLRALNTTRSVNHWSDKRSMATSTARASHSCWPLASPMSSLYLATPC